MVSKVRFLTLLSVLALLLLAAVPASAAPLAPIFGANSPTAIRGQYIVVLKPDATSRLDELIAAAEQAGVGETRLLERYDAALNGFAAVLPERAVEALRLHPAVDYIEVDQTVQLETTQSPVTWGLDRIDQRALPLSNSFTYNRTGSGVTAYIIDTGIRFSHNEFGGRAVSGVDKIDGGSADDCNGHGTHVAGTVGGATYGVAKGVRLVAVRVLNCSGSGSTSGVIGGVDWVTSNHQAGQPAVANMSLGGGVSTSLDTAVKNSISDGVTYAIAAGNSNANACNYSPARVSNAITVGATTSSDTRASYSNYGSCLDIFAPGSSITSAWYNSNTATNTISGTSMATPHVAGVAALYLQGNPGASPATVREALVTNATTNVVKSPGTNSPNRLLYTNY
jgi:subtilisin family serine protease